MVTKKEPNDNGTKTINCSRTWGAENSDDLRGGLSWVQPTWHDGATWLAPQLTCYHQPLMVSCQNMLVGLEKSQPLMGSQTEFHVGEWPESIIVVGAALYGILRVLLGWLSLYCTSGNCIILSIIFLTTNPSFY